MYYPEGEGKRNVVITDKPLKPVPSWLEKIEDETAAAKKKRVAAEKKQAKADAAKAEQDKEDIDDVTFIGEGEAPVAEETSTSVETI